MRTLLITGFFILLFSLQSAAQNNNNTLDRLTYEYYMKGDYRNLKLTANKLLAHGTDYYFLRLRLGIGAFNFQNYAEAVENLTAAIRLNSKDTISSEYIYNSYLLTGRKGDARLFLKSIAEQNKNYSLRTSDTKLEYSAYLASSFTFFQSVSQKNTSLYRESLKNSYDINGGFEASFLNRFKATVVLTEFTKTGTFHSIEKKTGAAFQVTQGQAYAKISASIFPGWEASLFGNTAIYPEVSTTIDTVIYDINLGAGVTKSWWKIRAGTSVSFSNFGNSRQIREEGYVAWLPKGNLNLYFTAAGMFQSDKNWGNTYQANGEAGFRVLKNLWMEAGYVNGNSFLYTRNQGFILNNSFQIPGNYAYTNIILLPSGKITLAITPFYAQYRNYLWNLGTFTKSAEKNPISFGLGIKLTYNNR